MPYDHLPNLIEYARANDGELPESLEFASENDVLGTYLNLGDDPQVVYPVQAVIRFIKDSIVALAIYMVAMAIYVGFFSLCAWFIFFI